MAVQPSSRIPSLGGRGWSATIASFAASILLASCGPPEAGYPSIGKATSPARPICEGVPPFEREEEAIPRVESSPFHSCVLARSGHVACWGENTYRQIGDGTWERRTSPTPVHGVTDAVDLSVFESGACVARRGGAVVCWGSPWSPDPAEVPGLHDVVRVAAWKGTACGVQRGGTVVCGGSQDGDGYERTVVGPQELLGVRDAIDVAVGASGVCVLHACGRVSCGQRYWSVTGAAGGRPALPPLTPVGGLDDARALVVASYVNSSMYERACALRASGRVACFPQTSGVAMAPSQLGAEAGFVGLGGGQGICAFDGQGRTQCFGPTLVVRERPEMEEVPDEVSLDRPISVTSGGAFRCATLASGKITCWGRELGGITGELLLPMPPGKFTDAAQLSVGRFHTCITRKNGDVGCWGPIQGVTVAGNDGGGSYSYLSGQPMAGLHGMAEVATGDGFLCARTRPGEVFCSGRDDKGQLGDGPRNEDRQLPTPIVGILDAISVVAAPAYACALRPGGEVWCWGEHPLSGTLGKKPVVIGDLAGVVEIAAGDHHLCGRLASGRIACVGAAPAFDREGAPDIVQIVAGAAHTCVLLKSGHVACAGVPHPTPDQLPEPAVHIAAGGSETCAALSSGRVSCWGGPSPWAPFLLVKGAKRVATSGEHACALLQTGELSCWGASYQGMLGQGPSDVRYPPTEVPFADSP